MRYQKAKETKKNFGLKAPAYWRLPDKKHEECLILAGGPSLNEQWSDIVAYADNVDVFTVNASLSNPNVAKLRPAVLVLQDPIFFGVAKSFHPESLVDKLSYSIQNMLRNVDWKLTIYVPSRFLDNAQKKYAKRGNISLAALPDCKPPANLDEEVAFQFMDKGIYCSGAQNVIIGALYLAVAARYKKIWLAGADGTSILSVSVDNYCRTFRVARHHYERQAEAIPNMPMESLLYAAYVAAAECNLVQRYAARSGVSIVNICLDSLRDSFPKGKLGKEPFPYLRDQKNT